MFELFKLLFKGILTIIMLPFMAAYLVFLVLYGLINHLICEAVYVFRFFNGHNLHDDDKETLLLHQAQSNNNVNKNNENGVNNNV